MMMITGAGKIRSREAGVTMLELVLAMGLSGLVLLAIVEFYSSYTSKLNELNNAADVAQDIESGEQIILKDLKAADPSYGILTLKDDTFLNDHGTTANFFDYFPDVPENWVVGQNPGWTCSNGRPCRTYTMKQTTSQQKGFAEIVLAVMDPSAYPLPSMIYDPSWPYTLNPCTACQTTPGAAPTFSAAGVYANGQIDIQRGRISHFSGASLVVDYPGYWHKGQALMFDTPTSFRPPIPAGMSQLAYDAQKPPYPNFFLFVVNGPGANACSKSPGSAACSAVAANAFDTRDLGGNLEQSNLLRTVHPVYDGQNGQPLVNVVDANTFFLNLPPIGGGQPTVRLRPVKLVKYSIEVMYPTTDAALPPKEQQKRTGALRVWRQAMRNGAWPQPQGCSMSRSVGCQMIAEWVKTLQFKRNTITDKSILFSLSKQVLPNGTGN